VGRAADRAGRHRPARAPVVGAVAGFDLAVRGGLVVRPSGSRRTNVYVRGGRVALVGDEELPARTAVDAADLLVLPGMVDTHVHFMDPADPSREDFPTGSAAAACAGVTTVVEHTHARPVRSADDLREKSDYLRDRSVVDFGLAAHAWPDRLEGLAGLWRAGVAYVKAFTCTTHGVPGLDAAHLLELFRRAAPLGAPCLVHCEDESITAAAEEALHAVGRDDPLVVAEWRNRDAEAVAVAVTTLLARHTGAKAVVAHASNVEIVDLAARERDAGGDVLVETCPQYLLLREDELREFGAFRKFTPPARAHSAAELEQMWAAVADRRIHHVASDHAPATAAQKTSGSIWDVHFGLPGVD